MKISGNPKEMVDYFLLLQSNFLSIELKTMAGLLAEEFLEAAQSSFKAIKDCETQIPPVVKEAHENILEAAHGMANFLRELSQRDSPESSNSNL